MHNLGHANFITICCGSVGTCKSCDYWSHDWIRRLFKLTIFLKLDRQIPVNSTGARLVYAELVMHAYGASSHQSINILLAFSGGEPLE